LRGSGRFGARERPPRPAGAAFQSPSLRGSGRFSKVVSLRLPATPSFNPLHCGAVVASGKQPYCQLPPCVGFNPLHCGAVVASWRARRDKKWRQLFQSPSLRGSGRFPQPAPGAGMGGQGVSIPFIAGQWSLRVGAARRGGARGKFQSPSLRGSGRFFSLGSDWGIHHAKFQSPSLRGSGRFKGGFS